MTVAFSSTNRCTPGTAGGHVASHSIKAATAVNSHSAHMPAPACGVQASDIDVQPWGSFVFFSDPDGNTWALQQLPAWQSG